MKLIFRHNYPIYTKTLKSSLFLVGLFVCFFANGQVSKKQQYVSNYHELAVAEMLRFQIPASITLAQGILESTSGTSALATQAKNHFGIKCGKDWALKDSFMLDDDTIGECFRKYETVLESYIDHSEFLRNRPRYTSLFLLDARDYKSWAYGLKQAGYATNPKYAELLIGIIEDLGLHKYDLYTADSISEFLVNHELVLPIPSHSSSTLPVGIQEFNRIKTAFLHPGENINQISDATDISVRRLSKYNDLSYPLAELEPGDIVYLQSKRRKAEDRLDTTGRFETIWDISQKHGIKISAIERLNNLEPIQQFKEGEVVYLRKKRNDIPEIRTIEDIIELKQLDSLPKTAPKKVEIIAKQPIKTEVLVQTQITEPKIQEYIVQQGDTLYKISQKFNVSVDNLQQLNGLVDSNIKLGQKLKINN